MNATSTAVPPPILPSWFKQRQAKADPAGDGIYKLTAPQLDEAAITIRQADNGLWSAHLLKKPDGPEIAGSDPLYRAPQDAWGAAFELYRVHLVV